MSCGSFLSVRRCRTSGRFCIRTAGAGILSSCLEHPSALQYEIQGVLHRRQPDLRLLYQMTIMFAGIVAGTIKGVVLTFAARVFFIDLFEEIAADAMDIKGDEVRSS